MKHLRKEKKFNRVRSQRKALFKSLLGSFVLEEKIITTETKAKETKRKIDRIINKAKKAKDDQKKVAVIRNLRKTLSQKAVTKLMGSFLDKFSTRNSGYARVTKLPRRKSDGASMAKVEFVD